MLSVNIGAVFEEFAVEKLKADGYKILAQNYRCRFGEIDIIALKKSVISFIEVKARYEKAPFFPEEAVTVKKLTHITLSASEYIRELAQEEIETEFFTFSFDFIGISYDEKIVKKYTHYKNFCTVNEDDLRRFAL